MGTISLVTLMIDYEVPPSTIIEAVTQGRLRPIVDQSPPASLQEISFDEAEARNLFWSYELRFKSEETRAALNRRLARHDSIVSGLIGAVTGSAITLLAPEIFRRLAVAPADEIESPTRRFLPSRRRLAPDLQPPPEFRIPIDSPAPLVQMSFPGGLVFSRPDDRNAVVTLVASAPGIVWREGTYPWRQSEDTTCVLHGKDWVTQYYALSGNIEQLRGHRDRAHMGSPLVRIRRNRDEDAMASFHILRRVAGDEWTLVLPEDVMTLPPDMKF